MNDNIRNQGLQYIKTNIVADNNVAKILEKVVNKKIYLSEYRHQNIDNYYKCYFAELEEICSFQNSIDPIYFTESNVDRVPYLSLIEKYPAKAESYLKQKENLKKIHDENKSIETRWCPTCNAVVPSERQIKQTRAADEGMTTIFYCHRGHITGKE